MSIGVIIMNRVSTLRNVTAGLLRFAGFSTIEQARSLDEARTLLTEKNEKRLLVIELSFLDIGKEIDFIREVRANPAHASSPIILTAPYPREQVESQLDGLEIDTFVPKTGDFNAFSETLQKALEKVFEIHHITDRPKPPSGGPMSPRVKY